MQHTSVTHENVVPNPEGRTSVCYLNKEKGCLIISSTIMPRTIYTSHVIQYSRKSS